MKVRKITEEDLRGKGVLGQPDTPGLSADKMQEAVEEIAREVIIPALNENADILEEFAENTEGVAEIRENRVNIANEDGGFSAGKGAWSSSFSVAVGEDARAITTSVAIGARTRATGASTSIAIGAGAEATGNQNCIQLGFGTNNVPNRFQVFDHMLMSFDGNIPSDRMRLGMDTILRDHLTTERLSERLPRIGEMSAEIELLKGQIEELKGSPKSLSLEGLNIGETVQIPVNGIPHNFIVIQQGRVSGSYIGFSNATVLLSERLFPSMNWNDASAWVANDFIDSLSPEIRQNLRVINGSQITNARAFILSHTEIGMTDVSTPFPTLGAAFEFFQFRTNAPVSERVAFNSNNGSANTWYTR